MRTRHERSPLLRLHRPAPGARALGLVAGVALRGGVAALMLVAGWGCNGLGGPTTEPVEGTGGKEGVEAKGEAGAKGDAGAVGGMFGAVDPFAVGTGVGGEAGPVVMQGARNEWLDAYVKVPLSEKGTRLVVSDLELSTVGSVGGNVAGEGGSEGERRIEASAVRVYRVVSLPFDTRSVPAVRERGPGAAVEKLPAALVPLEGKKAEGKGGMSYELPGGTGYVYVELRPTVAAVAGTYVGSLRLLTAGEKGLLGEGEGKEVSAGVRVVVDDLALSEGGGGAAAALYGEVPFEDLRRLFPRHFSSVNVTSLLGRGGGGDGRKYLMATERMDEIVRLCRAHRVDVGFTKLQPVVKYTPRDGLTFDWAEYDSLVMPWLTGEVDPSREGLSAFPLPVAEMFRSGAVDGEAYVRAVLGHFDQRRVLSRTILPGEISEDLLKRAGGELAEKVRKPARLELPARSLEGLRQVAWESFAVGRDAGVAGEITPTGTSAEDPGESSRCVWFYPGEWFGRTGVVPGVGIKWARRAQQDREILELASRRGASTLAQQVARRATRMGMSRTSVAGDLLTPMRSTKAWEEGLAMVRGAAVSRAPGGGVQGGTELADLRSIEEEALGRWSVGLEKPLMIPAAVTYSRAEGELRVRAEVELADPGAEVSVVGVPDGWEGTAVSRGEKGVRVEAKINGGKVRYPVDKRVNERGEALGVNGALTLEAVSGANRLSSRRTVVAPVVALLPSPGTPTIDARLMDWSEEELVAGEKGSEGLREMWTRGMVQSSEEEVRGDGKGARVYARWDADTVYLAFRLDGVTAPGADAAVTNFTPEMNGRAYGETLVRLRISPVGEGKELRLLLKPRTATVEASAVGVSGAPPRYAATVERGVWRAELAIPTAMLGVTPTAGVALAWNLVRHDGETGESSSVAGPVDRDYQEISGLMVMVERAPRR